MQRKFHLKSSYVLALVLLVAHALAVISIHALVCLWWEEVAVSLMLLSNLIYLVWRYVLLRSPMSCVSVRLDGEDVKLEFHGGQVMAARLGGDSFVTSGLTVLQLKLESSRVSYWLPILPDSLDAESYRQLRVLLKWGNLIV